MQAVSDIFWACLALNYLVDTNRAVYSERTLRSGVDYGALHTNSRKYCSRGCDGTAEHDATDEELEAVGSWLAGAADAFRWVNVQGPGFDDSDRWWQKREERGHSARIAEKGLQWFESLFPLKTEYEV
jgi:hypothetical protein